MALNISPPLQHSNSMNNHAQNSKGLLQAEQIYIGLSTSCSKFSAEFSKTFPVISQFELALTPPSILFSLRTLGNFPAFLRMCMMPIYLVPSYQCFCVFTLLSPKFMKLKLTKALNISPSLLHSNSMNNHAQKSKGFLQAGHPEVVDGIFEVCPSATKFCPLVNKPVALGFSL